MGVSGKSDRIHPVEGHVSVNCVFSLVLADKHPHTRLWKFYSLRDCKGGENMFNLAQWASPAFPM